MDIEDAAVAEDVLQGGYRARIGILLDVAVVAFEGGIDIGKAEEVGVIGYRHVFLHNTEATVGVEAEGLGVLVVVGLAQALALGFIVDAVVPGAVAVVDGGVVVVHLVLEVLHGGCIHAE